MVWRFLREPMMPALATTLVDAPTPLLSALLSALLSDYEGVRALTTQLIAPLSAEDCCVQSMPDASPAKWHLAHTTWFFETFVLVRYEVGFRAYDASYKRLFNSYYNTVGDKHPRAQRGMLTRPSLAEVIDYRNNVDQRMARLLAQRGVDTAALALTRLGIHHEQQHQELLLTDVKHLLSLNPQPAAYHAAESPPASLAPALRWFAFKGGECSIGHAGVGFSFDNETPRHKIYLNDYEVASRLVTNGEYLQFIEAGGYVDPAHWLAEGWDWVCANARKHPLYWRHENSSWSEFSAAGLRRLDPGLPLVHVSYYEADAYARWSGARLPTEGEWEHAATVQATAQTTTKATTQAEAHENFLDSGRLHPSPASGVGLQQLFGDAWEWTQSSYAPYPGFRPAAGAVGEYNGKFMVNQYVLRGGSCATPENHLRASYRNFFPAHTCWQFSGVRLARDSDPQA